MPGFVSAAVQQALNRRAANPVPLAVQRPIPAPPPPPPPVQPQGDQSPPWNPRGGGPDAGGALEVDPRLARERRQREAEAAAVELIRRQQQFSNSAALNVLDIVLGSGGDKATTIGRGGGFVFRKLLNALLDPFPEGGELGGNEEREIARLTRATEDEIRRRQASMVEAFLAQYNLLFGGAQRLRIEDTDP